jgi:hypothetical protein
VGEPAPHPGCPFGFATPGTPPPGPRKRGAGGGFPLARQSEIKSTTPCQCDLPMDSSNARTTRVISVDLVNAPTKQQVVVKDLPAPCA